MNQNAIIEGLISYCCMVAVLTFHEAGHAWMAWKRGDDTARMLGRVSLNPVVHMDMIGTVVLPLLAVGLGAAGSGLSGFIIGWGKPVPVNPARLKNRQVDNVLVSVAGPAMNFVVAMGAVLLLHLGQMAEGRDLVEILLRLARISLFLAFFNLLPIPPLDGSHVARYFFGWGEETQYNLGRYGMIIIIVVLQIPIVTATLSYLTHKTLLGMIAIAGLS